MRAQYTERTRVSAAPDEIWAVLTDLPGWSAWNTLTAHCGGALQEGARLDLGLPLPGGRVIPATATVVQMQESRCLYWRGGVRGLFSAVHGFSLIPVDEHVTDVVHDEVFTGILVRPILAFLGPEHPGSYRQVNEQLAQRVLQRVGR